MLVAISYATAVNATDVEKKESPLWRIRTRSAISEKISIIKEKIKTNFFGERAFFLPFQMLGNRGDLSLRSFFAETKWYGICP
jgi:hypothetical protein